MTLRFSIVVPTFNRRETLEVVLPRLLALEYPQDSFEIVLCDSGSTDGTDELVRKLASPRLRHLVHENRGRSGARNHGVRSAQHEYVLFTDADIIPDPGLLAAHAKVHAENGPACAVVGCEVQVDTLEEYEQVRAQPWDAGRHLHKSGKGAVKPISWLYYLTGNASAPRQKLLDVGIFDEQFQGYGHEDLELGYRLEKSGVKMLFCADAINYHWHPVSFGERCQKMRQSGLSTVRMWRKHRDPEIKLKLGWNPVSMGLHGLLGGLLAARESAPTSHLASEMVLQYHYVSGIKDGLQKLGG
ncbi:MAG: glycosyltransferase family 2 protein [Candidatus Xenobia bacterium]